MSFSVLYLPFSLPPEWEDLVEPLTPSPEKGEYYLVSCFSSPRLFSSVFPSSSREWFFIFDACLQSLPVSTLVCCRPSFFLSNGEVQLDVLDSLPFLWTPEFVFSSECFPPFEVFSGSREDYFHDYFSLYFQFYPSVSPLSLKLTSPATPDTWPRFFLAQVFLRALVQQIPHVPLEFTAYLLKIISRELF